MIGTLEDRESIREVIALYAHAIDRRRWGLIERLFHPDATFGFGPIEGDWRGFVEQARAIIDPCVETQHQLGQTLIGFVADGVAECETYLTATHTVPPGYPQPNAFADRGEPYLAIVAGRYVDRFEKRDGEWRIAHRQGLYAWRENRALDDAARVPLPDGACGRRDEGDPAARVVAHWLRS